VKETKDVNSKNRLFPCGRPRPKALAPISPARISEYQKVLRKFLRERKLKYSEQRWLMAKLILETGGHLDSQEIIEKVRAKHPSIGAATIYRNIKVLCDAGILEPSHQNMNGRDVFELTDDSHHDHILCLDCGEVFEFQNSNIESLQEDIARNLRFSPRGHRHVIHGHCDFLKSKELGTKKMGAIKS
jgi:Fur family ferric uptake transcriptional regulator